MGDYVPGLKNLLTPRILSWLQTNFQSRARHNLSKKYEADCCVV